jgi:excisionase family DNA binding protein
MTVTRLTVPEAAARLGVSERTVWRRIRAGTLPAARAGRRVLVEVGTAYPTAEPSRRRVAEAAAPYRSSADAGYEPGPWPYTRENIERQRQRLLARRNAAFAELERLAAKTRPDPDGLTGVDYLRELRDPDWEPSDEPDYEP